MGNCRAGMCVLGIRRGLVVTFTHPLGIALSLQAGVWATGPRATDAATLSLHGCLRFVVLLFRSPRCNSR